MSQLVAPDGTLAAHYEYDPFGRTVLMTGDMAEENPWRFSTKYWEKSDYSYGDWEAGLYYYRFRFYSPDLGRWINRDPIGEKGAIKLRSYSSIITETTERIREIDNDFEADNFVEDTIEPVDDSFGMDSIQHLPQIDSVNLFLFVANDPINTLDRLGLSYLNYFSAMHKVWLFNDCGELLGKWNASNRAGYTQNGNWIWYETIQWKRGKNKWTHYNRHSRLGVNSRFGSQGVHVFDVGRGGRRGIGIHAGRQNRRGWRHATNGCIRTTEAAMRRINEIHREEPIKYLEYNYR